LFHRVFCHGTYNVALNHFLISKKTPVFHG
jgi:hypothetical protein